jgi:hypothetical protein
MPLVARLGWRATGASGTPAQFVIAAGQQQIRRQGAGSCPKTMP